MAENCGLVWPGPVDERRLYGVRRDGWFGWSAWVGVDHPFEVSAYIPLERVAGPFWRRATAQGIADALEHAYRRGRYSFEIRLSATVLDLTELDAGVPVG